MDKAAETCDISGIPGIEGCHSFIEGLDDSELRGRRKLYTEISELLGHRIIYTDIQQINYFPVCLLSHIPQKSDS